MLLVAGDEDLVEGVQFAKEFGVKVALAGVEAKADEPNQSWRLVQAADTNVTLSRNDVGSFMFMKPPKVDTPSASPDALASLETSSGERPAHSGSSALAIDHKREEAIDFSAAHAVGVFLRTFDDPGMVNEVVQQISLPYAERSLPKPVDGLLLTCASDAFDGRPLDPVEHSYARRVFWQTLADQKAGRA